MVLDLCEALRCLTLAPAAGLFHRIYFTFVVRDTLFVFQSFCGNRICDSVELRDRGRDGSFVLRLLCCRELA
jgi:hypothetical protein